MDNDNTRDAAEPSPASAGSHGDVLADARNWLKFSSLQSSPSACLIRRMADEIERLRLTDAERDAVGRAAMLIDDTVIDDSDLALNDYQALRGLYERTK
jgi:hypothetical protein